MKNIYQLFLFLLITPTIALYSGNKNIKNKHSIYEVIAQSIVEKNKEAFLNQKKQIKKSITFFKEAIKDRAIFHDKDGKLTDLDLEVKKYCIIDLSTLESCVLVIGFSEKIFGYVSDSISNGYIALKQSTKDINNKALLEFEIVYDVLPDDKLRIIADTCSQNDQTLLFFEEFVNLYTAILDLL